jgi:NitT/TauT family transport system ATP-binding protein/taurine transport system ATP-binding protein
VTEQDDLSARVTLTEVGQTYQSNGDLLQMLAGFLEPTSGTIMIGSKHVRGPSPDRGVVFQAPTLYPWLSVEGNVEFGLRMRGMGKAERRDKATAMLNLVGLNGFGARRPYELSGGMQQRAQIARVLVNDPRIILMDEPYGALDPLTRERLQVELLSLWRRERKTVVFVTHSVEEAVFLSTRVLVMSARPGRVIIDRRIELPGDGPDVVRDPAVTATPEFQNLKVELAEAIYAAHA